MTEMESKLDK